MSVDSVCLFASDTRFSAGVSHHMDRCNEASIVTFLENASAILATPNRGLTGFWLTVGSPIHACVCELLGKENPVNVLITNDVLDALTRIVHQHFLAQDI